MVFDIIKIAKGNNSVDLTPEIHPVNAQARKLFYPEIPEINHSNPDMRINGILADLVTPDNWTGEKLKRLSKKFSDQHVSIAIISIKNTDVSPQEIMAKAAGYYTDGKHSTLKELWLVDKSGEIFKFIRTGL